MPVKPELISFTTSDDLSLPGLLYEPSQPTKRLVIFLHGNGSASIFYKVKKMNLFAEELGKKGWAFLPFNNRGAHYLKKFHYEKDGKDVEVLQGTAVEIIADVVLDLDAAIEFAQSRGYTEIVLLGESSGANKIVVYHQHRPNNICVGYALVGGGDDTGLFSLQLGRERFLQLLADAKSRVAEGTDLELLSANLQEPKFAYRALADILDPDGEYNVFPFYEQFSGDRIGSKELFQEFKRLDKPTLVLYGQLDEFCYRPAQEVVDLLLSIHPHTSLLTGRVAPGAEHSFSGVEALEAEEVVQWLQKIAP